MRKRVIALIAVCAVIVSVLAVPVSATMYCYEKFDTVPPNNDLQGVNGWEPYESPYKGKGEVIDGCAKFSSSAGNQLIWEKSYEITDSNYDHIVMFDIMVDATANSKKLSWQLFNQHINNGNARSFYKTVNLQENVWHTFMFIISNNGKSATLYHRPKAAAIDSAWINISSSQDAVLNSNGKFKIRFSRSASPETGCLYIDNYRIFTGTNVIKEPAKVGTTVVNAVSDITSAGNLKADFEIYSSDIVFDSANVLQPQKNIKMIMTAFDKNNKLLDCNVENKTLLGGGNLFSSSLTLSDDSTQDMYFNNIKDGGYVGVYLWEGMSPIFEEAIELR